MRREGLISSDSSDIFSNNPQARQSPPYDTPAPKARATSSSRWEEEGTRMSSQGCPALGGEVRHRPGWALNCRRHRVRCRCQHKCSAALHASREPIALSPCLAGISLFNWGLRASSPWPQTGWRKEWGFSCSSPGPCRACHLLQLQHFE